ncbi:Pleiotropic regulatory protein [Marinobacter nitratireducens]|uniref:Pleiotropic regulatory protein n=2 Tax=Marinobacter nitratireducens TaxID=1137280 RepID=A0A072N4P5_9GAMM|nr:Pleiotropic regulatory protein [Marinobacter nitratireducens]
MTLSMLRPVGNRVPLPEVSAEGEYPWHSYNTEFMDSGTSSLYVALVCAKKLRPDVEDPEVIMPAYGCPDLIAAAVAAGVRPVLVDLVKDSPWMDEEGVTSRVSENTVAILAVNFLGILAPLSGLRVIADEHSIFLIEDSAQAIPPSSAHSNEADFVVLSFGRGKPVNLMGGGALLYRHSYNSVVSDVINMYPGTSIVCDVRWHLKRGLFNLLMSRIAYGVLLRIPMLHLGETRFHALGEIRRLSIPRALVLSGITKFSGSSSRVRVWFQELHHLEEEGWLLLHGNNSESDEPESNFQQALRFGVLAQSTVDRDCAIRELNKIGIGANALYGVCLPAISGVSEYTKDDENSFPNAENFAKRLLTLPVHDGVTDQDIRKAVGALL